MYFAAVPRRPVRRLGVARAAAPAAEVSLRADEVGADVPERRAADAAAFARDRREGAHFDGGFRDDSIVPGFTPASSSSRRSWPSSTPDAGAHRSNSSRK